MAEKVDIKGLDKAEVLLALYNATHVQGLGFLQAVDNYSIEDAKKDIEDSKNSPMPYRFDYLHGRVMKVNLSEDSFDPYLFDRDNYDGAAQDAIDKLRKEK